MPIEDARLPTLNRPIRSPPTAGEGEGGVSSGTAPLGRGGKG